MSARGEFVKMKRQRGKPAKTRKRSSQPIAVDRPVDRPVEPSSGDRRELLRRGRNWGIVALGLGAGGWFLVDDIAATSRELDLTQIGRGVPTVVQIHDPQCPKCQALQREARQAMKAFGDGELRYLVANIRQEDGRRLARTHQVSHVTLLLFDAGGERRRIIAGQRSASALEEAFRRHVARYGADKAAAAQ